MALIKVDVSHSVENGREMPINHNTQLGCLSGCVLVEHGLILSEQLAENANRFQRAVESSDFHDFVAFTHSAKKLIHFAEVDFRLGCSNKRKKLIADTK